MTLTTCPVWKLFISLARSRRENKGPCNSKGNMGEKIRKKRKKLGIKPLETTEEKEQYR